MFCLILSTNGFIRPFGHYFGYCHTFSYHLSKSKSWNYCEGRGRTPPKKSSLCPRNTPSLYISILLKSFIPLFIEKTRCKTLEDLAPFDIDIDQRLCHFDLLELICSALRCHPSHCELQVQGCQFLYLGRWLVDHLCGVAMGWMFGFKGFITYSNIGNWWEKQGKQQAFFKVSVLAPTFVKIVTNLWPDHGYRSGYRMPPFPV